MRSPFNSISLAPRLTRTALLTGFGLVMFLFESNLPRPLPWAKPGLANVATLLALYLLGAASAWAVTLLRVLLGSFFLGSFLNPGFWLSLAGGLAAVAVMTLLKKFGEKQFSVIGLSLAGALAHVLAQIMVAGFLIVRRWEIVYLLPAMLWPALFAGVVVGIATLLLLERLPPLHSSQTIYCVRGIENNFRPAKPVSCNCLLISHGKIRIL
jgi:heptaprenyl diphosphate synthase